MNKRNISFWRLCLILLLMVTAISINAQSFTTRKHKLIDAYGKAFVIKGMNNPHAWFGQKAYDALDQISAVGCNTVRRPCVMQDM